jgi:hypothetical protein
MTHLQLHRTDSISQQALPLKTVQHSQLDIDAQVERFKNDFPDRDIFFAKSAKLPLEPGGGAKLYYEPFLRDVFIFARHIDYQFAHFARLMGIKKNSIQSIKLPDPLTKPSA